MRRSGSDLKSKGWNLICLLQDLPPLTTAIYRGTTLVIKNYPTVSFLWLLGLILMFFASGLTVSEEVSHSFLGVQSG